ncbi:MAG: FAD/NAD(P)-binding protein [Candidatus Bathyarchaeota archaeon]|nr:MAG: FAD/NAD(P)-binding protein [Candidatus Bathyarchaeota archaeon]
MSNPYLPNLVVIKKIISENDINDIKTFKLAFQDSRKTEDFGYKCGQFAEVSLFGVGECPIGIASSPLDDFLEFTVKKVGMVTTALHNCEEEWIIGVRGPYGNGWPIDRLEGHDIYILGGGFAFTTLRSLIKYVLHKENRESFGKLTAIYGARDPGELLYKYDLNEWTERDDIHVIPTIDRPYTGWTGRVGFPNQIIKEVAEDTGNSFALVCGPPIMIRFTVPVIVDLGFPPENILTSLEMRMKCGIGKCGRCNVGDKFVCKDGPVFSYKELQNMPKEY